MDHNRLSNLENSFGSDGDGVETVTICIVHVTTYFDADGQRCQRTMPAKYDEAKAVEWPPHFNPETRRWEKWRWLYPIEATDTASAG